jgi:hypothetical protein
MLPAMAFMAWIRDVSDESKQGVQAMKHSIKPPDEERTVSSRFLYALRIVTFITVIMVFSHGFLQGETLAPSVLQSTVLEQGDEYIHGFVYHGGYLWASTRTAPCRVLRIDPETLRYEKIVLDESYDDGEDLVMGGGWVWVVLYGTPSRIIRVDPDTLTWQTAVAFKPEKFTRGGSLVYAFGSLWVGGGDGKIARIDTESLACEIYDYSTALGRLQVHALTSGDGYLWASSPIFSIPEPGDEESIVLRINPHDPREYAAVFLQETTVSDDMVFTNGHLYAGGESSKTALYKIAVDLTYTHLITGEAGYLGCSAMKDTLWGALSGTPGKLVRLDAGLHACQTYTLPQGFNHANEIAFDTVGGMLFVTSWDSPTRILKINVMESSDRLLYASLSGKSN